MCCATRRPAPTARSRRATVRIAHACRGRGGRGCRCHVGARPHLALAAPVTPPARLTVAGFLLHHAPRRPQGPPLSA